MIDNVRHEVDLRAGGALLLALTIASILRTLVVPRGLYSSLVMRLWRLMRTLLRACAAPFGTYRAHDRAQAWLAPLVLIGMLFCWLCALLASFTMLLYADSGLSWSVSLREAGSSLFTLGFASGERLRLSALDFLAAVSGPVVIALQIAYLPTLYGSYNRRELEVTLLQSWRASRPGGRSCWPGSPWWTPRPRCRSSTATGSGWPPSSARATPTTRS